MWKGGILGDVVRPVLDIPYMYVCIRARADRLALRNRTHLSIWHKEPSSVCFPSEGTKESIAMAWMTSEMPQELLPPQGRVMKPLVGQ